MATMMQWNQTNEEAPEIRCSWHWTMDVESDGQRRPFARVTLTRKQDDIETIWAPAASKG